MAATTVRVGRVWRVASASVRGRPHIRSSSIGLKRHMIILNILNSLERYKLPELRERVSAFAACRLRTGHRPKRLSKADIEESGFVLQYGL